MKRRKSRKNPAGRWIALGIGTAAALGLAGYGIYRWRKSSESLGSGEWKFRLIPQPTPGEEPLWLAQVVAPSGAVTNMGPFVNQTAAVAAAQGFIASNGGAAVPA